MKHTMFRFGEFVGSVFEATGVAPFLKGLHTEMFPPPESSRSSNFLDGFMEAMAKIAPMVAPLIEQFMKESAPSVGIPQRPAQTQPLPQPVLHIMKVGDGYVAYDATQQAVAGADSLVELLFMLTKQADAEARSQTSATNGGTCQPPVGTPPPPASPPPAA